MQEHKQMRSQSPGFKREPTSEEMLSIIFGYVAKIANERNLDHILMHMANMGRDIITADRCTLWLLDERTNELWTRVGHGISTIRVPAAAGFVGYSVQHNLPLLIDDAYKDERFNPQVDKETGYRTKAVLVIPINNSEGEVMGAFQAINKMTVSEKFTMEDMNYLSLAASYSGKALESALLHQELEQTQREIIYMMGEVGESRSKETGNHVKRVAEYSYLLALKLGMSEEEANLLKMASPMHDIGKVAVPDSVLNKPGRLTPEEYEIMKSHTEVGYNLLKSSPRRLLKIAAKVAQQHHEKWNGMGYPQGLKREEIDISARITALADVFDALASDRCYKKAWELGRVLDLIKEERGQHFDPRLVDIFLENINEILIIRDKYRDKFIDVS